MRSGSWLVSNLVQFLTTLTTIGTVICTINTAMYCHTRMYRGESTHAMLSTSDQGA
ncbi:hypothetical protein BJX61DRAFT_489663 [Aspergillus egyptiacus]|nr:hypothetical protein BJX61DRAFT_489663 [Aspergillus egyptiacus]